MTTPPNLNDLVGILLRFRLHQFAVTTDIEKAFLNVGLETQDRDVTRFFWFDTPTDPSTPLSTYRFKSVLFGATSSPFILNSVLQKHLRENRCEYTDTLMNDLYVDNILSSFPTESALLKYFDTSRDLFTRAGFNLRSWASNSQLLRDRANSHNVLDKDELIKVLGLRWNTCNDTLTFAKPEYTDIEDTQYQWKYCPTDSNPADMLSRGVTATKFLELDLWMKGPEWLTDKSNWPQWKNKESHILSTTIEQGQSTSEPQQKIRSYEGISKIMDIQRYSSYQKLLRITAYMYRFINNCRNNDKLTGNLSVNEIQTASTSWIRDSQLRKYPDVIESFKQQIREKCASEAT
ncbi:Hypothetical predicted protein [Mytilus galloprovincialis]|uniref:Reverse transcriptase domain-containing protein n=1 Tax=Mytilus galloprovincialis TaxID=29158 RepID=A0A8B6DWY2_MYTGA|nr:Hypothetical predicted protein [Mytilus galloprovincialis]